MGITVYDSTLQQEGFSPSASGSWINEMVDLVISDSSIGIAGRAQWTVAQHKVQAMIETAYTREITSYETINGTINIDSGLWQPQQYQLTFELSRSMANSFKRFLNKPGAVYEFNFKYNDVSYYFYGRILEQVSILQTTPYMVYQITVLADTLPLVKNVFTSDSLVPITGGVYGSYSPPPAPTLAGSVGVIVSGITQTQAIISFTKDLNTNTVNVIVTNTSTGAQVFQANTAVSSVTVTGLSASTGYTVYATGTNSNGSGPQTTVTFTTSTPTTTPPGGPSNLVISNITSNGFTATWSAPTTGGTPTEYLLELYKTSGGYQTTYTIPYGTNTYTATDCQPNTTYYVKILAQNSAGYTIGAQSSNFTTLGTASVPSNLSNFTGTILGNTLTLSWSSVSGATGYTVQTGSGSQMDVGNITATSVLAPSATTTYTLRAYNSAGSSSGTTYTYTPSSGGGTTPTGTKVFQITTLPAQFGLDNSLYAEVAVGDYLFNNNTFTIGTGTSVLSPGQWGQVTTLNPAAFTPLSTVPTLTHPIIWGALSNVTSITDVNLMRYPGNTIPQVGDFMFNPQISLARTFLGVSVPAKTYLQITSSNGGVIVRDLPLFQPFDEDIQGGVFGSADGTTQGMIYGSSGNQQGLNVILNQGDGIQYVEMYLTVSSANPTLTINGVITLFQYVNPGDVVSLSNLPNNYFIGVNNQSQPGIIQINRYDIFNFGLTQGSNSFTFDGFDEFGMIVYEGVNIL